MLITGNQVDLSLYREADLVCLVPSLTELLCAVGLSERIAGRTKFCIHPARQLHAVPIVGGTKNVRIDEIGHGARTLVIANKEENQRDQVLALAERVDVWLTEIDDLDHVCQVITSLSTLGAQSASKVWEEIAVAMHRIKGLFGGESALYLIWKDPYMSVGSDTFISFFLKHIGLNSALPESLKRYPVLSEEYMASLNPDLVFLSSEPFPFKPSHIPLLKAWLPNAKLAIVDGEMFSWYGSRLQFSPHHVLALAESLR
jgi:ABC-type Fe3+-hydroxamate transport system substrate-binding protein